MKYKFLIYMGPAPAELEFVTHITTVSLPVIQTTCCDLIVLLNIPTNVTKSNGMNAACYARLNNTFF